MNFKFFGWAQSAVRVDKVLLNVRDKSPHVLKLFDVEKLTKSDSAMALNFGRLALREHCTPDRSIKHLISLLCLCFDHNKRSNAKTFACNPDKINVP